MNRRTLLKGLLGLPLAGLAVRNLGLPKPAAARSSDITRGLTMHKDLPDNEILTFKSSDVDHTRMIIDEDGMMWVRKAGGARG